MCDDADQDISELDIELRTWNKLQKDMKLLGFREGAVKGKDLSLQEGFNLGYSDGFKLGECVGMIKGLLSYQSELGFNLDKRLEIDEKAINEFPQKSCVLCTAEETITSSQSEERVPKNFEDFLNLQQSKIDESIKSLNLGDLGSYIEKG